MRSPGYALLGFRLSSGIGLHGKREDSCILPFKEPRQQHDLAIGELKRIMIGVKCALVDLGVVTLKHRELNPSTHLFIDCARQVAKRVANKRSVDRTQSRLLDGCVVVTESGASAGVLLFSLKSSRLREVCACIGNQPASVPVGLVRAWPK